MLIFNGNNPNITFSDNTTQNSAPVASTVTSISGQNNTATSFLALPQGTTAQRPNNPPNGSMRYNTTIGDVELYVSGAWVATNYTAAPVNTVAPVVSGTSTVGSNLSCTTGTWSNTPTAYTYQWLANSTSITNATSNTYTLTLTEKGANISCNVTATNIAGSATANSNSVGPVTAVYSVDYLVVAGGGGGGYVIGGGGGAGGYLANTTNLSQSTAYTITIGAGSTQETQGSNSSISLSLIHI